MEEVKKVKKAEMKKKKTKTKLKKEVNQEVSVSVKYKYKHKQLDKMEKYFDELQIDEMDRLIITSQTKDSDFINTCVKKVFDEEEYKKILDNISTFVSVLT